MSNSRQNSELQEKLLIFIGTIAGGAISLVVFRNLSPIHSAIVGAIALAGLTFASTNPSNSTLRWTNLGAIAGIIIGASAALAEPLATAHQTLDSGVRLTVTGLLSLAGLVSGGILGRKIQSVHVPLLKEFLTKASSLTVGLFAIVVTTRYLLNGLEEARAFSSRLSTATTILVTSLVVPGVIGYFLGEHQKKVKESERNRR